MHFHLPKPLHGWREFVGEVGIIVVGVLIALGAEQVVEHWHHERQVDLARDAVRAELENAGAVAYERLAIQPCLQGRIRDLAKQLAAGEGPWRASPMVVKSNAYFNVMPFVYRAPYRSLPSDGWRTATASGTVDFMNPELVRHLSAIYDQIADFDRGQSDEEQAATQLSPLAFDRNLDGASRTEMLAELAQVDRINSLLTLEANQMIEAIRAEKLGIDASEVRADRKTLTELQRDSRGDCVRTDLPLDLG